MSRIAVFSIISGLLFLISLFTGPNPLAIPPLAILLGVLIFAEKRSTKVDTIIRFSILFAFTSILGGCPVGRNPAVEGVITDKETAKPVANVKLRARWYSNVTGFGAGGTCCSFDDYAYTDTEGFYKFPAKWRFNYFSFPAGPIIDVDHPDYAQGYFAPEGWLGQFITGEPGGRMKALARIFPAEKRDVQLVKKGQGRGIPY